LDIFDILCYNLSIIVDKKIIPMQEEERDENSTQPEDDFGFHDVSKGHKIAAAALAFFALFVVVMWVMQFNKTIYQPTLTELKPADTAGEQKDLTDVDLKRMDTDKDGLSDWDELNIHKTSPYLEDSDSDGFTDKQELDSGNDPACPQGRDCYGGNSIANPESEGETGGAAAAIQDSLNALNAATDQINQIVSQPTTGSESDLTNMMSGGSSAAELRQILLQSGVNQNDLNQITDEQLLESYNSVLSGQ